MTNPEYPHEISDEGEASKAWSLQTFAKADYILDNLGDDREDGGQTYREYHWSLGDFEHEIFLRRWEQSGQKNYVMNVHRHGSDKWDSTYSISGDPEALTIKISGIDEELAKTYLSDTKAAIHFMCGKVDQYLAASEVDFPQNILQKPVSTYVPQELADFIDGVMVEMMAEDDLVRNEVLSRSKDQRPVRYFAMLQVLRQRYMINSDHGEELLRQAIDRAEQTYMKAHGMSGMDKVPEAKGVQPYAGEGEEHDKS